MKVLEEPSGIIWWVCFLASTDSIYDHISRIGAALSDNGQLLVVIGPEGDYSRCKGFAHLAVPLSIADQGRKWAEVLTSGGLPMTATALQELMDAEFLWCGTQRSLETDFLVLRALSFWEKAFAMMRPCVILTWGTTLPFSRLMLRLAQITQTPSYAMERGLTENTLMMNLVGQCQVSNIGVRLPFIDPIHPNDLVDLEWSTISSYYKKLPQRNYSSANRDMDQGLLTRDRERPAPAILYLGAFDVGSGMAFDDIRTGDRLGGWIRSSSDGAEAVAECLSQLVPGAALYFKSHPAGKIEIRREYKNIEIVNCDTIDFRQLIAECDVCITPISTTQIYGFIYDKPIITLANGFFAGRDITYEAHSMTSLKKQLLAAIEQRGWADKREIAKKLITALFREEFIGLDDEVPCALRTRHLVEHLSRFTNYKHPSSQPALERLQQFQAFSDWVSGRQVPLSRDTLAAAIGIEEWTKIEAEIARSALKTAKTEMWSRLDPSANSVIDDELERILLTAEVKGAEFVTRSETARRLDLEGMLAKERQRNLVLEAEIAAIRSEAVKRLDYERQLHLKRKKILELEANVDRAIEEATQVKCEAQRLSEDLQSLITWGRRHTEWRRRHSQRFPFEHLLPKNREGESSFNDPIEYLLTNPDVAASGIDPILHWERFGKNEGRKLKRSNNISEG